MPPPASSRRKTRFPWELAFFAMAAVGGFCFSLFLGARVADLSEAGRPLRLRSIFSRGKGGESGSEETSGYGSVVIAASPKEKDQSSSPGRRGEASNSGGGLGRGGGGGEGGGGGGGGGGMGITSSSSNKGTSRCTDGLEVSWPFYKASRSNGKDQAWPSVGWTGDRPLELALPDGFKFYMYDDGDLNTTRYEECFMQSVHLAQDLSNIDHVLPVFRRMYAAELAIWPVLRNHPHRTMNPDEASLFVVGFSVYLAEGLGRCREFKSVAKMEQVQDRITERLAASPYYKRRGGLDHMIFFMRFKLKASQKLKMLLDSGSLIVTTDRLFWNIISNLPNVMRNGSTIIVPYVAPYWLDNTPPGRPEIEDKSNSSWYFFAGTYSRRAGSREKLSDLAQHIRGADFRNLRIPKTIAPGNGLTEDSPTIVNKAAEALRRSSVCLAPQGDAITSGRLFEAMAGGCVPVMSAPRDGVPIDLPFPSLIDWDSFALFTDNFDTISKADDGIARMGRELERLVGSGASPKQLQMLRCMQREARRVFVKHLSYLHNPRGLADSLLFEAWVHLQKRGIISGQYA